MVLSKYRIATLALASFFLATACVDAGEPAADADPETQAALGCPPVIEHWGVGLTVYTDGTYAIEISQMAEGYLGTTLFDGLENRFNAIPEITDVVHMDRDLFEFKVSGLSDEEVIDRFWNAFVQASKEAFGGDCPKK